MSAGRSATFRDTPRYSTQYLETHADELLHIRRMARSDTAVIDADEYHIEYAVGGPDAESRLLVETPDVRITVEGTADEVARQFERHYASAVNVPVEELPDVAETYPMPDPDDLEWVPADASEE